MITATEIRIPRWRVKPLSHCKRGHEFTEENTIYKQTKGFQYKHRQCRACKNAMAKERWIAEVLRGAE